jgi:ASC-1-like (ASCH) protein
MTKTLLEYIEQNKKEVEVRIKFAFEPEKEQLDKLERHLTKYDAQRVSAPQKTMLQSTPIDFPDLKGYEIYIIDAMCGLPVSSFALQTEICKILGISESQIRVRVAGEPSEVEQEALEAAEDDKKEYKARLEDPKYSEVKQEKQTVYGNKPTADFIKEIRKQTRKMTFAKKTEIKPSPMPTEDGKTSPISGRNTIPDPMKIGKGK